MNTINLFKKVTILSLTIGIMNSCVKDDDYSVPSSSTVCDLDSSFGKVNGNIRNLIDLASSGTTKITEDFIVEAYVSSSDKVGNIYKVVYIQDSPSNPISAIALNLDRSSTYNDFPVGSKIRIKAKGLYVGKRNESLQIGMDSNLNRISDEQIANYVQVSCDAVEKMIPVELNSISEALNENNIGKLVTIKNVQFSKSESGKTYATLKPTPTTENRILEDIISGGKTLFVRNSGFADFAGELLPTNSGSITGILSKYNNDYQLFIRDLNDVNFSSDRVFTPFVDTFESISSWNEVSVIGDQKWAIVNFGNPRPSAAMNGFVGGAKENEDWLILKPIEIPSTVPNLFFSFDSDVRYSGEPLEVYISKDYKEGDPSSATWEKLSPNLDKDNSKFNPFVNSGDLDISSYKGSKISVAFKYKSTTSGASTWEIDNVKIGSK